MDGLTDLPLLERELRGFFEGTHNLKLEVEDRAGNISHDYIINATVDITPPPTDFRLLTASDSGQFNDDQVTQVREPSLTGRSEVGATINIYANDELVGQGIVADDGDPGPSPNPAAAVDGMGEWTIQLDELSDGPYDLRAEVIDIAGNAAASARSTGASGSIRLFPTCRCWI